MEVEPMASDAAADSGSAPSTGSTLKLHDLQPDVLHNVLHFLGNQELAHLCLTSSRLAANILQACQHWAPKVESWLLADPTRADLLQRLRLADPLNHHSVPPAQHVRSEHQGNAMEPAAECVQQQQQPQGAAEQYQQPTHQPTLQDGQQDPAAHQQVPSELSRQSDAMATPVGQQRQFKRLNWRQIWYCIERAQQGPWQLDVQALTPAAAPNGVLLTFELLLQQPAPPVDPGSSDQQAMGWRESVTVISFVLDKKTVEIVVDASGRVTSPQRDWCQGCIQLQPGQPRLLALEISYIMPVPAWFLHPCTLAAPRPCKSSSCCNNSCTSSISGMGSDQAWDSYSTGTSSGCSSMSISNSIALCSAGGIPDDCSLASSSMTSSGSINNFTAVSSGSCGCCGRDGRPRLPLDLSCGFGTYVSDPRYIDAAHQQLHRGLDRMELSSKVCWKPSKVQSWLGRLLPGIRSHSSSSSNSNAGTSSPTAGSHASSNSSAAGIAISGPSSPSNGVKQGAKPSFAVSLSKVAAWQVPSDTDRRFAEGFLFWAVQHKLEHLLMQYGILQPSSGKSWH